MAHHRRKNLIASRRRVEDEGEEDGGPDAGELEDDSLSEGSAASDDEDAGDGSETSHNDAVSNVSPEIPKAVTNGHPTPSDQQELVEKIPQTGPPLVNGSTDTDLMLNGLTISDQNGAVEEVNFDDLQSNSNIDASAEVALTINSSAQMDQPQETPLERRRREHEEYKQRRDADPAFVPNRGAFFMHDHRHAGPAANGFRPFGRGRGRGRGGIGGPFAPASHMSQVVEPTDAPWTHDMHETINEVENRDFKGAANQVNNLNAASRLLPQAPRGPPPNRSLSTTRHIGNVQLRVLLQDMKEPVTFPGVPIKQYTRLPDHRPPLRRDKPVRISLPDNPPRYIFPAVERSFIFIPRAMRPNQQGFGSRKGRSGLGSFGGYSGQTSAYGGSFYGSVYTPSVAMSRRSSLAYEIPRDNIISPTGSTMSRPPMPMDTTKPVVRLPPSSQMVHSEGAEGHGAGQQKPDQTTTSIQDLPRPQTYPLPQKPTFRENRPNPIPMHQPRPQKAVSVADIESPANMSFNTSQQYPQPFHQQVPAQVNGHGYSHEALLHPHSRNASYPSQASTGTPLSQIPERAIHAQPFQPNTYQPQQGFYSQQYPIMPPQQSFFYPQQYNPTMAPTVPAFVSATPQQVPYAQNGSIEGATLHQGGQASGQPNLVAQEVNGMVYYYDASQIPAVTTFPTYPGAQSYPIQQVSGVAMQHGMMTPSPDGFYYPQPPQGVVYYPQ